MLPYKQSKGRVAFKNITCWQGVPENFKETKAFPVPNASADKLMISKVSIKELSRFLGGNVE